MKTWLTLLPLTLAACLQVYAAEPKTTGASKGSSDGRRPLWMVSARLGPALNALDPEVYGEWEHEFLSSMGITVGVYYTVPRVWNEIYFFFGPDVAYLTSTETLGDAKIESTLLQLSGLGGVAYKPRWLDGHFGGIFATGFQLLKSWQSKITTPGFSKDLSNDQDSNRHMYTIIWGVFYEITPEWRPLITLETRMGEGSGTTQLNFGVNYGF